MDKLEEILEKYKFPMRKIKFAAEFKEIEDKIGFLLPDDYKFFVQEYTAYAEIVGPEFVSMWDVEQLIVLNMQYGILDNLPLTLAIGSNGGGDFVAIEYSLLGNYRIVLSPFIDLDKESHLEIGTSFTDFFIRLDSGKEWFSKA